MKLEKAILCMNHGEWVTRKGWEKGKSITIKFTKAEEHLAFVTCDNQDEDYKLTFDDAVADDWEVVKDMETSMPFTMKIEDKKYLGYISSIDEPELEGGRPKTLKIEFKAYQV